MEARARTMSTATRASVSLGLREPTVRTTSMNAPRALVSMEVPVWMASTPLPASVQWALRGPSASWKLMSVIHILA